MAVGKGDGIIGKMRYYHSLTSPSADCKTGNPEIRGSLFSFASCRFLIGQPVSSSRACEAAKIEMLFLMEEKREKREREEKN